MAREATDLQLPDSVTTLIEVGRVERELSAVDEFALQSKVRTAGKQPALPKTSRMLEELAKANDCNLLVENDRDRLKKQIVNLRQQAPVVHLSFASEPSPTFLSKIVGWFRREVDPKIILQVGLQPSIAAGCVVRTSNKYFDLSLRKHFFDHRQLLLDKIRKGQS